MISVASLKGGAMNDDVIALLKVHQYFQGSSDEALDEVARQGRVAHFDAGALVREASVVVTSVGFVLRGRVKAVRVDAHGAESRLSAAISSG
jgi:hypothetical protein